MKLRGRKQSRTNIDAILEAEELIEEGEKEKAIKIIDIILSKLDADEDVFANAERVYSENDMYEEEIKVLKDYKSRFGKELDSDIDLEDLQEIVKDIKKQVSESLKNGVWTFKAKTFWLFTLPYNYKEVQLSGEGIVIDEKTGSRTFSWDACSDAYIKIQEDATSNDLINVLYFNAGGKKYKISQKWFENGNILVSEAFPKFIKTKRIN
jgi:hypothetical protein